MHTIYHAYIVAMIVNLLEMLRLHSLLDPYLLFTFLWGIGIIEVFVNASDESLRSSLSLLVVLLFFSTSGFRDSSLGLKSEFSLLSVVFIGLLVHSSNGDSVWVQFF